jgi:predicted NUDIX family phosphoesterase
MSRLAIDLIGGGLQPDELIVNECKDIFRNEVKEIKEEIGVKEENILKVYGLGILLSSKFNVIFIFLTKLNLTREEVLNTFQTNNDDEMSDLEFVPEHQISKYLENMSGYRPLVAELYEKNWSIE